MAEKVKNVQRQKLINIIMIVVVVLSIGGIATGYLMQCDGKNCPSVEAFVRSFGAWAPVFFGVIYFASSPIPMIAPILSAAGGLVFGPLLGTLLVLVFATGSSLIPFFLARRLGSEWIAKKLKGKNIENMYKNSEGSGGFLFVLLMRLIPVLPWEIQNYVGGLSKVPVLTFVLATLLGIIPGSFSLAFLGSSISDPTSWKFYFAIGLNVVIALIPTLAIFFKRRKEKKESGELE